MLLALAPAARASEQTAAGDRCRVTEATVLSALRDAQRQLGAGQALTFELLSGAAASSRMAERSPKAAFLSLPLARPFSVQRGSEPCNPLWQTFRIVVLPQGPGQMMWDVEVAVGIGGQLERVEMTYKAPPPF